MESKIGIDDFKFSFFLWKYDRRKQRQDISLTHQEKDAPGAKRDFLIYAEGRRTGKNYIGVIEDGINAIIKEVAEDSEIEFQSRSSDNPGDTFKGSSITRQLQFDAEVVDGQIKEPYLNLTYHWKGWEMKKKKFFGIADDLESKYGEIFFPRKEFQQMKSIQLYSILFNMNFYQSTFHYLQLLQREHFSYAVKKWAKITVPIKVARGQTRSGRLNAKRNYFINKLSRYQKALIEAKKDQDHRDFIKYGLKLISAIESLMPLEGLWYLIGGEKNMWISGRVEGFRDEDENGDSPYVSKAMGKITSRYILGPIQRVRSEIGMTSSEFYGYWLTGRL